MRDWVVFFPLYNGGFFEVADIINYYFLKSTARVWYTVYKLSH